MTYYETAIEIAKDLPLLTNKEFEDVLDNYKNAHLMNFDEATEE